MTSLDPASWPSRGLTTKLVGVDGHGGSGKSTLASMLSQRFAAEIVHTDDFASMANPVNWWPSLISYVLHPLSQGGTSLSYPLSSWWDEQRDPVVDQPVTPITILEGVSALRLEFRPYLSFGIFVDTPFELCFQRGMARDLADGRPYDEVERNWLKWYADENVYLERDRPDVYADLVVDGTKPFAEQLV